MPIIQLPDGRRLDVPDDASEEVKQAVKDKILADFPELGPTNLLGSLLEMGKGFPRGIANTVLTAGEGLGSLANAITDKVGLENLIDEGEDNELIRLAREGQKAINESFLGAKAPYRDKWLTKAGEGLGSLAAFLIPGTALTRGLGWSAKAATAGVTPLAVTVGTGEAEQRIDRARQQGIEVSDEEASSAALWGALIGTTEMMPVTFILRRIDRAVPDEFKRRWQKEIIRALAAGGVEGSQEVAASLMQDAVERNYYNPEEIGMGGSLWDEFTVGGFAGFAGDLALRALGAKRASINDKGNKELEAEQKEKWDERLAEQAAWEVERIRQAKLANQPLGLPAPVLEEVAPTFVLREGETPEQYARRISRELDDSFPIGTTFTPIGTTEGFNIVDSNGVVYGENIQDVETASQVAGALNKEQVDSVIDRTVDNTLFFNPEDLNETDVGKAKVAGERILDPDTYIFPNFAIDYYGNTTNFRENFQEDLTWEEALQQNKKLTKSQRLNQKRAEQGIAPSSVFTLKEVKSVLPAKQFDNLVNAHIQSVTDENNFFDDAYIQALVEQGNTLTAKGKGRLSRAKKVKEARDELAEMERVGIVERVDDPRQAGLDFAKRESAYRLVNNEEERIKRRMNKAEVGRYGESRGLKPPLAIYPALKNIAETKNINFKEKTPAWKFFFKQITGKDNLTEMTQTERKLVWLNMHRLPSFTTKKDLPDFTPLNFTPTQFEAALDAVINARDTSLNTIKQAIAGESNFYTPYMLNKKAQAIKEKLVEKGVSSSAKSNKLTPEFTKPIEPTTTIPVEDRQPLPMDEKVELQALEEGVKKELKGRGLNNIRVRLVKDLQDLSNGIPLAKPVAAKGGYLEALDRITISLNGIDPNGTLSPDELRLGMAGVIDHEMVHGLRAKDLFTEKEWNSLRDNAKRINHPTEVNPETGKPLTLFEVAERDYGDISFVQQQEESVAELYRLWANGEVNVTGKPRSLLQRIADFFKKMSDAMRGAPNVVEVLEKIKAGEIAARPTGEIRTLRILEEQGLLQNMPIAIRQLTPLSDRPGEARAADIELAPAEREMREPTIHDTGRVVGGPKGVKTERQRNNLVQRMVALINDPMTRFEDSQNWYEDYGSKIAELTRGNPELTERVARLTAIYSQTNQLGGNVTATIKAMHQIARGEVPLAGRFPNQTVPIIEAALEAPVFDESLVGVNNKIANFYRNIIDPALEQNNYPEAVTIDVWMQRQFGYTNPKDEYKITDSQYIYALDLVNRITDQYNAENGTNLLPRQIQAGMWINYKNSQEFLEKYKKPVEQLRRRQDNFSKRKVPTNENGRIQYEKESKALQKALSVAEEKLENYTPAYANLLDYVERATAYIEGEVVPSSKVNNILVNANRDLQQRYTEAVLNLLTTENGNNALLDLVDPSGLYTFSPSIGGWEGKITPNVVGQMILDKTDGVYDMKVAEDFASMWGYVMSQDAVPYARYDPNLTIKGSYQGVRVEATEDITDEQIYEMYNAIENKVKKAGYEAGFTRYGNNFYFMNYAEIPQQQFNNDIIQATESLDNDLALNVYDNVRAEGDMIGNNWEENRNGENYLQRLDTKRRPDLLDGLNYWREAVESVTEEYTEEAQKGPELTPPTEREMRSPERVAEAVATIDEQAEVAPAGTVPLYSVKASPEAKYVALNPTDGQKPSKELRERYMRTNHADMSPEMKKLSDDLVAPTPENKTFGDTLLDVMDRPTLSNTLTKLRQAFVFKYARIDQLGKLISDADQRYLMADTSAVGAAIFSDRARAYIAGSFKHGMVAYRNGGYEIVDVIDPVTGKPIGGLIDILTPIYSNKSKERIFQTYRIVQRAVKSNKEGDLIKLKGKELQDAWDVVQAEVAKYPEIEEASRLYDLWNDQLIQFMEDTGIVTPEGAKDWRDASTYYPFYRQFEEEIPTGKGRTAFKTSMLTGANSLIRQPIKGSDREFNIPPIEAIGQNVSAVITSGMKNIAGQRVMRDAVNLGVAVDVTAKNKKGQTIIRKGEPSNHKIMVNGEERFFFVNDPLLMESITMMSQGELSTILNIVATPATVLREAVTRDPGFILANMLRDTLSAWTTSGSDMKPVIDTVKNFNKDLEMLERMGVSGGYDYRDDPLGITDYFNRELTKKGMGKNGLPILKQFKMGWDWLGQQTTKSDMSTRRAVYDDVLARTGNQTEAAFQAIEIINFSRRGGNPLFRIFTAGIPFLNARIQGLDVFYRAGRGRYSAKQTEFSKGQIQKSFILRGLTLATISYLYYLMVSDEEEYKNARPEIRDNNWIIPNPFGGVGLKIPIPFEVGVVFKTIPETMLRYYYDDNSPREVFDTLKRSIGTTLELNPLGMQATLPLLEATLNHSFFTQRDIVPYYMETGLEPWRQTHPTTNALAQTVGEALNISPIKIEHVLRGYTGTLGTYVLDAVDSTMRTFSSPEMQYKKRIEQYPILKRFLQSELGGGYATQFYDLRTEVNRMVQTLNDLNKRGTTEEAWAYYMTRPDLLAIRDEVLSINRYMSNYRQERDSIMKLDTDLEIKRDMLYRLETERDAILSVIPKMKKQIDSPFLRIGNVTGQ